VGTNGYREAIGRDTDCLTSAALRDCAGSLGRPRASVFGRRVVNPEVRHSIATLRRAQLIHVINLSVDRPVRLAWAPRARVMVFKSIRGLPFITPPTSTFNIWAGRVVPRSSCVYPVPVAKCYRSPPGEDLIPSRIRAVFNSLGISVSPDRAALASVSVRRRPAPLLH
jgi:hypothetical protein